MLQGEGPLKTATQRAHCSALQSRRRRESDLSGPRAPFGNEIRSTRNPRNLRRSTPPHRDKSNKLASGSASQEAALTIPLIPVDEDVRTAPRPKCPDKPKPE